MREADRASVHSTSIYVQIRALYSNAPPCIQAQHSEALLLIIEVIVSLCGESPGLHRAIELGHLEARVVWRPAAQGRPLHLLHVHEAVPHPSKGPSHDLGANE